MAYMRFEKEAAARLWQNIEHDRDLLDSVPLLSKPALNNRPAAEIRQAELKLITFLANAGFGEEDVRLRRGTHRREYFQALSEFNPDIFQLSYSREPLILEILLGRKMHQLNLGHAIGYSTIVPLTEDGYREYLGNKVSAFQFTERHIAAPEMVDAMPCQLYGEGVFHIRALADPQQYPGDVTQVAVPAASFIFEDVFRHFGRFMPRLRFVNGGRLLQTDPPNRLPVVIFADNGAVAKSLTNRGFIPPPNYQSKGIAGYPRYVLNTSDYNRRDLGTEAKDKIRKLLNAYLQAMNEESQPMVDWLEPVQKTTSKSAKSRAADIVVITMRDDEYEAILSRVGDSTSETLKNRTYAFATLKNRHGVNLRVALVKTLEQGMRSSQDTARDAIDDLKPSLLVLAGIGGAVPHDDFTLGDVVVATRLHDFSLGAHLPGGNNELTNIGGPMTKKIQDVVVALGGMKKELQGWNTAQAIGVARPNVDVPDDSLSGSAEWKAKTGKSLARHFHTGTPRQQPLATARAVAVDGYLHKDPGLLENWLKIARELGAVEMELPGVFEAARRRNREFPILAIRGISDVVGYKRSPEWTTYAANAAGSLCIALMKNLPADFFPTAKRSKRAVL